MSRTRFVRLFASVSTLAGMLTSPAFAVSATPGAAYDLDLGRYFSSDQVEQSDRESLLASVDEFEKETAPSLTTPQQLSRWLDSYETLSKGLQKHDLYVYLRAEENSNDRENEAADEMLSGAIIHLNVAVEETLADLGASRAQSFIAADAELARYGYFVKQSILRGAHDVRNQEAVRLLAQPALDSLASSYKTLRGRLAAAASAQKPLAAPEAFDAKWAPYIQNEDSFAALLLPVATLQTGKAKLQGFADAPEATYFRAGLSVSVVHGIVAALGASKTYSEYQAVVASAAARRLGVQPAELHAWDLDAADNYSPPPISFADAVTLILAAEQPMGAEYAAQYAKLLDPQNHRVALCREETCDRTGFSVGYAGLTSGLFYGNYTGSTDSVRAVAHEAGHAVHHQFMSENQPRGVYNLGPHFVFESFAIFNELLLLDHCYRAAPTQSAKAYYLHKLLDDMTFQVYGSARETELEESIYAGTRSGALRTAADLDSLTLQVFGRYFTSPFLETRMKVYWASNRLYFTDPLYDVNYLFAGLLALEYLHRYEQDPKGFSRRYVAMLKNGFTDAPQVLERKFLDIDLDDPGALVGNATASIGGRTAELAALYARSQGDYRSFRTE